LPLRIGAASTKLYIERGADWCGQGKNNSFFEGCGMSTCQYGNHLFSIREGGGIDGQVWLPKSA